MSVHYKFVLDKRRKREDKIYPLRLRIYDNDGNKEKSLDIKLHENDWDDGKQIILQSDPNYKKNNFKFTNARNKVERKVMLAEDEEDALQPEDIIASITKKAAPRSKTTVRTFSDELIADMTKAGKAGHALAYQGAINSIINYTGNEQLKFEDITYKLLDKYNNDMLAKGARKGSAGLKVNAIAAYLRSVRAVYNKAIKAEVVDAKYYPFSKFTIETEETISRALTLAEIKAIVRHELQPDTPAWHNRNYFLPVVGYWRAFRMSQRAQYSIDIKLHVEVCQEDVVSRVLFCVLTQNFYSIYSLTFLYLFSNGTVKNTKGGRYYYFEWHRYTAICVSGTLVSIPFL